MNPSKRLLGYAQGFLHNRTAQAFLVACTTAMVGCQSMGQPAAGEKDNRNAMQQLGDFFSDAWNAPAQIYFPYNNGVPFIQSVASYEIFAPDSNITKKGYDDLAQQYYELSKSAQGVMDGEVKARDPVAFQYPINWMQTGGLADQISGLRSTTFDQALLNYDQWQQYDFYKAAQDAQLKINRGEKVYLRDFEKAARVKVDPATGKSVPHIDLLTASGTPSVIFNLLDFAVKMGPNSAAGKSLAFLSREVSIEDGLIAETRAKVTPASQEKPLDVFVQNQSNADMAGWFRGTSDLFGNIPVSTPVSMDSFNEQNQGLFKVEAILAATVNLSVDIQTAPQLEMSQERGQALVSNLNNEYWQSTGRRQMGPGMAYLRQLMLAELVQTYPAGPERANHPAYAEMMVHANNATEYLRQVDIQINQTAGSASQMYTGYTQRDHLRQNNPTYQKASPSGNPFAAGRYNFQRMPDFHHAGMEMGH